MFLISHWKPDFFPNRTKITQVLSILKKMKRTFYSSHTKIGASMILQTTEEDDAQ